MFSKVLLIILLLLLPGEGALVRAAAPDPYKLLLYNLLDLDQSELGEHSDQTPLKEQKVWFDLYTSLRDQAETEATADRVHLKLFLMMGWIARIKSHFATIELFNSDVRQIFDKNPDAVLRVLSEEDFLLPVMCTYLAKSFFFEESNPNGREKFIDSHRTRMSELLGTDRQKQCLEAFWRVKS